ncbi:uncharacterized protein J4E92_006436 [Alternaria infectoria]|uniref:uncharacterized protein n=1 Tax=Alternaria infectoria TaxID=45303 RepID=UPI00221E969E|nr:uncharacterized protein J4E92_006436 [Alternaria infectoria]KAI4927269.1 hypothetical protein J4E92_006436 [Alternaria infectoria]
MSPTQSSPHLVACHPQSLPRELTAPPQNQPGAYNPLSPDFFWDTAYTFPAPMATTPLPEVIKATHKPTMSAATHPTAKAVDPLRALRSRQTSPGSYRAQPAKGAVFGSARAPPPANPWGGDVFARIKADDEVVRERAKEESEREGGLFRPKMTQTWRVRGGKKVVEVFEEEKGERK